MNKKLLTAAIAAVIAAPTAALANDVTIYGVIHASVDYRTDGFSGRGVIDPAADWFSDPIVSRISDGGMNDGWDVASRATRIGFKGSEDLANGLKAIWKIEAQADIADRGGDCSVRNMGIAPYGTNSPTVNQGFVGRSLNPNAFRAGSRAALGAAVAYYDAPSTETETEYWDEASVDFGTRFGYLEGITLYRQVSGDADELAKLDASLAALKKTAAGTPSGCDSGSWWTARNAYIGLAGGWGTFLVGRHDTPYKMSTGKLDLFADTLADYNSTIGFVDIRTNSAIAYVSPSWGGLSFAGAMVAPQVYASNGSSTADADGLAEAYSLALTYDNAGFFASAAYEVLTGKWIEAWAGAPGAGLDDNEKVRLGLGWSGMGFTIGGLYEWEDNLVGEQKGTDATRWQVQAGYTFGNNMIKAMYGQGDWSSPWGYFDAGSYDIYDIAARDRIDGDSSAWAIGLDHNFSKRTKAYVLYTNADYTYNYKSDIGAFYNNSDNGDELVASGRAAKAKLDGDAGGFSIGMIHSF